MPDWRSGNGFDRRQYTPENDGCIWLLPQLITSKIAKTFYTLAFGFLMANVSSPFGSLIPVKRVKDGRPAVVQQFNAERARYEEELKAFDPAPSYTPVRPNLNTYHPGRKMINAKNYSITETFGQLTRWTALKTNTSGYGPQFEYDISRLRDPHGRVIAVSHPVEGNYHGLLGHSTKNFSVIDYETGTIIGLDGPKEATSTLRTITPTQCDNEYEITAIDLIEGRQTALDEYMEYPIQQTIKTIPPPFFFNKAVSLRYSTEDRILSAAVWQGKTWDPILDVARSAAVRQLDALVEHAGTCNLDEVILTQPHYFPKKTKRPMRWVDRTGSFQQAPPVAPTTVLWRREDEEQEIVDGEQSRELDDLISKHLTKQFMQQVQKGKQAGQRTFHTLQHISWLPEIAAVSEKNYTAHDDYFMHFTKREQEAALEAGRSQQLYEVLDPSRPYSFITIGPGKTDYEVEQIQRLQDWGVQVAHAAAIEINLGANAKAAETIQGRTGVFTQAYQSPVSEFTLERVIEDADKTVEEQRGVAHHPKLFYVNNIINFDGVSETESQFYDRIIDVMTTEDVLVIGKKLLTEDDTPEMYEATHHTGRKVLERHGLDPWNFTPIVTYRDGKRIPAFYDEAAEQYVAGFECTYDQGPFKKGDRIMHMHSSRKPIQRVLAHRDDVAITILHENGYQFSMVRKQEEKNQET